MGHVHANAREHGPRACGRTWRRKCPSHTILHPDEYSTSYATRAARCTIYSALNSFTSHRCCLRLTSILIDAVAARRSLIAATRSSIDQIVSPLLCASNTCIHFAVYASEMTSDTIALQREGCCTRDRTGQNSSRATDTLASIKAYIHRPRGWVIAQHEDSWIYSKTRGNELRNIVS